MRPGGSSDCWLGGSESSSSRSLGGGHVSSLRHPGRAHGCTWGISQGDAELIWKGNSGWFTVEGSLPPRVVVTRSDRSKGRPLHSYNSAGNGYFLTKADLLGFQNSYNPRIQADGRGRNYSLVFNPCTSKTVKSEIQKVSIDFQQGQKATGS